VLLLREDAPRLVGAAEQGERAGKPLGACAALRIPGPIERIVGGCEIALGVAHTRLREQSEKSEPRRVVGHPERAI
jgi:hypothetical protein